MSIQIDITADTDVQAQAVAVAVSQGLASAGFTDIAAPVFETGSEGSLLDALRASQPEFFNTRVDVNFSGATVITEDTTDDVPEDEEVSA